MRAKSQFSTLPVVRGVRQERITLGWAQRHGEVGLVAYPMIPHVFETAVLLALLV